MARGEDLSDLDGGFIGGAQMAGASFTKLTWHTTLHLRVDLWEGHQSGIVVDSAHLMTVMFRH